MKKMHSKFALVAAGALLSLTINTGSAFGATPAPSASPSPSPSASMSPSTSPSTSPSVDPSANPSTSPGMTPTDATPTDMDQYTSLSAAMASYYANTKGTTLGQYIVANPTQASTLLGVSPDALGALKLDSPQALSGSLSTKGLTLDTSGYSSMASAVNDIQAKSGTLDASVVEAGANYAAQMAALHTPALSAPNMPGVDKSLASEVPTQGLAFGLFLNKSLTNLVMDSPDVFGQIQSSGLGSASAQKAWDSSMLKAMKGSQSDLTQMLPSQCGGVFLTAMASGQASAASKSAGAGAGCGSCLVAGLYSHNQMSQLFNPTLGSTTGDQNKNTVNASEWGNLPAWQQKLVTNQNSNITSALDNALGGGAKSQVSGSCDGSSTVVKSAAGTSLNKTLAFLK